MVNYQNPVTIEREYSAYAFLPSIGGLQPDLPVCSFNSGARESLACCGRYIHVSPSVLRAGLYSIVLNRGSVILLAGNFSVPLTLSGISSEGIVPTVGQYGSVAFWGVSSAPTPQPKIADEPYLL